MVLLVHVHVQVYMCICCCMWFMFVIGPEPKPTVKGEFRTFRMWLDTNQYQKDMERIVKGEEVHT